MNSNMSTNTNANTNVDKNGASYLQTDYEFGNIKINVRIYTKNVRFSAILPINNFDFCKVVLDLKVGVKEYYENPQLFHDTAYQQAKNKAWWMEESLKENIYHDTKGIPFTEETIQVGEILEALPGEVSQVKVRFRYYPKTVRPMMIYISKPILLSFGYEHTNQHTELLDSIYSNRFVKNQVVGNIRKSLRSKGFNLSY